MVRGFIEKEIEMGEVEADTLAGMGICAALVFICIVLLISAAVEEIKEWRKKRRRYY